ncbi:hypothetical protein QAD02_004860 [Eretmocerus hayati]|uniref:Uncharacterized protein n=1 Tax=Eretmocerus hayati TaxID=131215 RepID=A0ACC2NQZ3_9HYME|nr:hypothetical protein QAD02_004860 [Eretmocerus hayati]
MAKSQKWIVDSGILRKKCEEEPQELLVFGYGCKLFRDDDKARLIDQGKHLIPWMGDNSLKIDRYDGRGALGDLRAYEPPPGGFDYRAILTEDEYKVEQLCDEERYRSLHSNEVEEHTYHEEEIKRLHQALDSENVYNQVGFNYDEEKNAGNDSQSPKQSEGSQDEDEVFVPEPGLEIPEAVIIPETKKLNAIIIKTALFISQQGGQMEVLIKAKQANNPQFSFLSVDGGLHPYYKHVLEAIKSGKYNPEKEPEKTDPEPEEDSDDDEESYLHPSLVSSLKVEAAPSIPSISYKPSVDCAYSLLVNKITGKPPVTQKQQEESQQPEAVPPPPMPPVGLYHSMQSYYQQPNLPQQYIHSPVIYQANGSMPTITGQAESLPTQITSADHVSTPTKEVTPLVAYEPTPPKPLTRPSFIVPPADVQIIIDKMASYVAKNGKDFEAIVKNKGDPRFNFLELSHQYHGYYAHKLTVYEGAVDPKVLTEEELLQKQEIHEEKQKKLEELQKKQERMEEVQKRVKLIQAKKKGDTSEENLGKQITTVSFSIKKPKEGDNNVIEKRSALPLEESDDEVEDGNKEANSKPTSPVLLENESPSPKNDKESSLPSKQLIQDKKLLKPLVRKDKDPNSLDKSSAPDQKSTKLLPVILDKVTNVTDKSQGSKLVKDQSNRMKSSKPNCPIGSSVTTKRGVSDVVDLTIDDDQEIVPKKPVASNKKKLAREKSATLKAKQLQMERRKKAMMFLSKIQMPSNTKSSVSNTSNRPADSSEKMMPPLPSKDDLEIEEIRINTNSLMNIFKESALEEKRPRPRSRSRSSSTNFSEKHRSHKKHKKKKSSHKSHHRDDVSSSRSYKMKKSKKSHHRSRSRSPHRHHHISSRYKKESTSSDSSSSSS